VSGHFSGRRRRRLTGKLQRVNAIFAWHLGGFLIPARTQPFHGRLDYLIVKGFQRDQHDACFRVALDPPALVEDAPGQLAPRQARHLLLHRLTDGVLASR